MAKLGDVKRFLDSELKIYAVKDSSINGLQVQGGEEVKKVGLAVDANYETLSNAKNSGCDLLFVHHGILWEGQVAIRGVLYQRVKFLVENTMSLYAAHLPLDIHYPYGNAAGLALQLGVKKLQSFGSYGGVQSGFWGEIRETPLQKFQETVEKTLGAKCTNHFFGRTSVRRVGIVTGSGSFALHEMLEHDIDVLVTGDERYGTAQTAKEAMTNVILGGHYETEVFGVKAFGQILGKKFGLATEFIGRKHP